MTEKRELGTITSTFLGYEDHGILTFFVHFDFGGTAQGFGGYELDEYSKEHDKRFPIREGATIIAGIIKAAGVEKWEDLKGTVMWVERENAEWSSPIRAIEAPKFVKGGGRFDIRDVFPQQDAKK